VTGLRKGVGAFRSGHTVGQLADPVPESVDGACPGFAQQGFERGENLLDPVQVR
jgi:hypothetical protein